MKPDTLLVHAGGGLEPDSGAIAPSIHLSTTFEHTPEGEATHDHVYIRMGNPTQDRLEEALATIEDGKASLVYASGMAAVTGCMQTLAPGAHILMHKDVYSVTRAVGKEFLPNWNIEVSDVDMTDLEAVRRALRPNTELLWAETPSNPAMDVVDIGAVAEIAHGTGAQLAVDNTFATPVVQRPLQHGADIVMHSMTKYLGGHSDVQGGALVFREDGEQVERVRRVRTITGGVLSPFNAWLILRGLRSLGCRMARHVANAEAIAAALAGHPGIEGVDYPGLPDHPGHAVATRQMDGYGGMLSLRIKGAREDALRVVSQVRLIRNATSLGGVESLIEHRQSIEGPGSVTAPNLLRLSTGLEAAEDLIDDLVQALE